MYNQLLPSREKALNKLQALSEKVSTSSLPDTVRENIKQAIEKKSNEVIADFKKYLPEPGKMKSQHMQVLGEIGKIEKKLEEMTTHFSFHLEKAIEASKSAEDYEASAKPHEEKAQKHQMMAGMYANIGADFEAKEWKKKFSQETALARIFHTH